MSAKWNVIASFVFLLCLGGCESMDSTPEKKPQIHNKLIMPRHLDTGSTTIVLSDLMLWDSSMQIDFYNKDDLNFSQQKNGKVNISTQTTPPPLSYFTIQSGQKHLDIPFYHSRKVETEWTLEDTNSNYEAVYLIGDMTQWQENPIPLQWSNGIWKTSTSLLKGQYEYKFLVDGEEVLDPNAYEQKPNGIGGFNSIRKVGIGRQNDGLSLGWFIENRKLRIQCSDPDARVLVFWDNQRIPIAPEEQGGGYYLQLPFTDEVERSHLRIFAANEFERAAEILIPLESGRVITHPGLLNRDDFHTHRMYFLMVDRFYNGNSTNDVPTPDQSIHPRAQFQGGDLEGVLEKLEEGYWKELSLNMLWLSPIVENPEGSFGLWDEGGVYSKFSAYHGYWPVSFNRIDSRFGSAADLHKISKKARAMDMGLLLDFVANHVHEEHPVYQQNKEDNWATDLHLPDGRLNTELWDEHRLTTWFDTFLPTLRLDKPEIAEMLSDSALYWLEEFSLMGFRHDASKHIPLSFWRLLTEKVRKYERASGQSVIQIGETYGPPDLISSYIDYGLLDAQFDFNLYDAAVMGFLIKEGNLCDLAQTLEQSLRFYGQHHLMGNMSGNQDKPRAMSLATAEVDLEEDTKLAGWTRKIEKQTQEGFERLALMHAFNFAIPGIPVVYYGDEIGMPGGNDPDNRAMMRFEKLTDQEISLRNELRELSEYRASRMALQYGTTEIVSCDTDMLILFREYGSDKELIAFNRSDTMQSHDFSSDFRDLEFSKPKFSGEIKAESLVRLSVPARSYSFIQIKQKHE